MENIKLINAENVENIELIGALKELEIIEDIEDIQEIDAKNNMIILDNNQEYLYFDKYEDAEATAVQYCVDIIQDCGLSDDLIFQAEIQGLIDKKWFADFWYEVHEQMTYNDDIDYIATNEEMEQLENGEISEEEIRDAYFNSLQDSIKGQEIEEYKFQVGDQEFNKTILSNDLIDIDALAQYCVDVDDVAHFLAAYDGEELEYNNYYLYRLN